MKRQQKRYETPQKAWYDPRLEDEEDLIDEYGLKNKKEVWRAESKIRKWRREARKLTAASDEEREHELLEKLQSLGLIAEGTSLDEILELNTEDILERRLQSVVYKKGLAQTVQQARQFVVHGHISINGETVTVPSYLVQTGEESNISLREKLRHIVEGGEPEEEGPEAEAEESEEEETGEAKEEAEEEEGEVEEVEEEKKEEETEGEEEAEEAAEAFDPSPITSGTVAEAKEELDDLSKEELEAVLEAEKDGKDRKTLKEAIEKEMGE